MARKTFFSFHYERDVWRVGQVRNCNVVASEDEYGFIDAAQWESIRRQGDDAIRRWINEQLNYTTVTAVLIGAETAGRPWVQHEIEKSWNRGNGLLGIYIHNVKDQESRVDVRGRNPFELFKLADGTLLSSICKTYDWVNDDGRKNLGTWIEDGFQIRAKYASDQKLICLNESRVKSDQPGVIQTLITPGSFVPRSPWCADYADRRR